MNDTITLRHLGPDDLALLLQVEEGLFDNPIRPDQAAFYLASDLHDMIFALDDTYVVGMASGHVMHHPDKAPAYFINEVGVRESHRRRGIAAAMCEALRKIADQRGGEGIWVASEGDNTAARALYRSLGARETPDVVVYDWDDPAMDPQDDP